MKTNIIIALAILFGLSAYGNRMYDESGSISGTITDSLTGTPLPYANVMVIVNGLSHGSATDINGIYRIKPLEPGYYDLQVSFIGYKTLKVRGVKVTAGHTTYLNRALSINEMETIVVIEDRWTVPLIQMDNPSVKIISNEEIEKSVQKRSVGGLIATYNSNVTQSDDGKELYFRGSRTGSTKYIVDGMAMPDEHVNIPSGAIGSISVYTGGIPAMYGDLTGGVVVITTKSYFDKYKR